MRLHQDHVDPLSSKIHLPCYIDALLEFPFEVLGIDIGID
jgi:hypothetical protein